MLFEQLLSNPHIPGPIKALLSQLQNPLLRAAVNDESFLDPSENPAHQLFNKITQTGISWMPEETT